jgi:hypothetical protein
MGRTRRERGSGSDTDGQSVRGGKVNSVTIREEAGASVSSIMPGESSGVDIVIFLSMQVGLGLTKSLTPIYKTLMSLTLTVDVGTLHFMS